MKHLLPAVLLLAACQKDNGPSDVAYTASGRMCAVEWTNDGTTYRDTIVGQFVFSGGQAIDTINGTGKWNIKADEGERLFIRACPLVCDSAVVLSVHVDGETASADSCGCATLGLVFHQ